MEQPVECYAGFGQSFKDSAEQNDKRLEIYHAFAMKVLQAVTKLRHTYLSLTWKK